MSRPPSALIEAVIAAARAREGGTDAVIATDVSGTIVYWNDHAIALYGWAADDAMGRNILDVTPTYHSVDEAARIMEQLSRGNEWSGEFIVRHRDGTPIVAHVTNVPVLHENTVIGVIGISRRRRDTPRP